MSDIYDEIKSKYSYEINSIRHRLRLLEEGRIKEFTGANMDGYLATNIVNLRKELNELLHKIINESDSHNDELIKLFK